MNKLTKLFVILAFSYAVIATVFVVNADNRIYQTRKILIKTVADQIKQDQLKGEYYQFSKDLIAYMMVSYTITSPDPVKGMTKILRDKGYSDTEVRFFIGNSHTLLNNESERLYGKNLNQLFTDKTYRPFNGKDNFFNDFWRK